MVKPELFVTPGYGEHMLERLHYSQALRIGDRIETSGQGGWSDNFQIPERLRMRSNWRSITWSARSPRQALSGST